MGKIIGGGCLGIVVSFVVAAILTVTFAFVLKPEGMLDVETLVPTTMYLVLAAVISGLSGFMAGLVARAIAKSPNAVYGIAVISLGFGIYGLMREASPEQLEQLEQLDLSWFTAMSYAQLNAPKAFSVLSLVLSLSGLALGGLKMTDFKKPEDNTPTDAPVE